MGNGGRRGKSTGTGKGRQLWGWYDGVAKKHGARFSGHRERRGTRTEHRDRNAAQSQQRELGLQSAAIQELRVTPRHPLAGFLHDAGRGAILPAAHLLTMLMLDRGKVRGGCRRGAPSLICGR